MSDKIDLAEISGLARRTLRTLGRVAQQRSLSSSETTALAEAEEMLALVRVASAAMAYTRARSHGFTVANEHHYINELAEALAAFTDSRSELADSAKENSDA